MSVEGVVALAGLSGWREKDGSILTYSYLQCGERLLRRVCSMIFDGGSMAWINDGAVSGVTYVDGEVIGMSRENGRIEDITVQDADGSARVGCGDVMNAAGPWANDIARMAGYEASSSCHRPGVAHANADALQVPVRPRKRSVFVFDCPDAQQITNCPLVIDPSGAYAISFPFSHFLLV